jgi:thiol-disulfide isomerase/thioredoxin
MRIAECGLRNISGGVVLLLLLAARPATAQEDEIGISRGATPPTVTIEDLDGKAVDLGQWVGKKPVVIEFWATWCPLCAELFPKLEAVQRRHGDAVQVVVVAVGVSQSPSSIRRHLARHPMGFPVLWDGNGAAVRAFQAPGTSYVVMLDAKGKVVYTGYGAEQDLAAAAGRLVTSH